MYNLKRIGFAVLGAFGGSLLFIGIALGVPYAYNFLDRYIFSYLTPIQALIVVLGIAGALVGGLLALDVYEECEDYDEEHSDY
ncbi:MAG: hypothetical protein E6R03_14985 [Hyphomicrobiaceae bacterium]|nr:MAG: hypothetical protein E6R03_14985 [Hyphomicrobiaceae bacterium]